MLIAAFLFWLLSNAMLMAWVLFPRRTRFLKHLPAEGRRVRPF